MRKDQVYISTISTDAVRVAQEYGLGLDFAKEAFGIPETAADLVCSIKSIKEKQNNSTVKVLLFLLYRLLSFRLALLRR